MRVSDRALPSVDAHPFPPGVPLRPVIAIEPVPVTLTWDQPGLVWDDPANTWDFVAPVVPWSDVFCDYQGMTIESGHPDDDGLMQASRLVVQLDNHSGRWSQYNVDGTLANYGPGRHVAAWATDGATAWWLFYGRVSRWDERADGTVEIEAFDATSDLAQDIGTFTPGAGGDHAVQRLTAILAAANYSDRRTLAAGTVTLTAQETQRSPLEEAQTVALSDGGELWVDADGTVTYSDRTWRAGRADQPAVPVLSDNVCNVGAGIVWDTVISTNDTRLADRVVLENVAGLRSSSATIWPAGVYVIARTDQQWTTQLEGDTLAAFILAAQSRPRFMVDAFDVFLFDPRQALLWRLIDTRLFDRVQFVHRAGVVGGEVTLAVTVLVVSIDHDVTPGSWVMTVGTTRVVDYARAIYWDSPPYTWDDPSPAAVWAF